MTGRTFFMFLCSNLNKIRVIKQCWKDQLHGRNHHDLLIIFIQDENIYFFNEILIA
jgi:hypothetical protein